MLPQGARRNDLHGEYLSTCPQAHGLSFLRGPVGEAWRRLHQPPGTMTSLPGRADPQPPAGALQVPPPRRTHLCRRFLRLPLRQEAEPSPSSGPGRRSLGPGLLRVRHHLVPGRPGEARPEEPRRIPGAQRRRRKQRSKRWRGPALPASDRKNESGRVQISRALCQRPGPASPGGSHLRGGGRGGGREL